MSLEQSKPRFSANMPRQPSALAGVFSCLNGDHFACSNLCNVPDMVHTIYLYLGSKPYLKPGVCTAFVKQCDNPGAYFLDLLLDFWLFALCSAI
jgi:hypothetical protein